MNLNQIRERTYPQEFDFDDYRFQVVKEVIEKGWLERLFSKEKHKTVYLLRRYPKSYLLKRLGESTFVFNSLRKVFEFRWNPLADHLEKVYWENEREAVDFLESMRDRGPICGPTVVYDTNECRRTAPEAGQG